MFKPVDPNQNFVEMEKKWLEHWEKTGIIQKYLHKNDPTSLKLRGAGKTFSFLDGPITANNPMGVHHAWGRTYKDLWQKFFNLLGHKQRFQNGFDCQGLWVEVEVEKELKLKTKKDIENLVPGNKKESIAKFVQLCRDRVYKYAGIQTDQSKRLGYFMDWDHSYYTMSDENNYMIWHFLKVCYENGWIYKGRDSVPWCPRCETAISQHEMLTEDYKELVHQSIYFKLPIIGKKNEYLLVWTTTPWTLPANIAVAVDTKLDYSLVEDNKGEYLWIAHDLIEKVLDKQYKKIVITVKGQELVGHKYKGPFDNLPEVSKVANKNPDKFHIVIATDEQIMPISKEEGTGMVHIAVSAGSEDFKLGKKYDLPMIPVIEDNADYLPNLGFLSGKNAKKHPEIILDYMAKKDDGVWVYKIHNYKHRYPACWRCKTELVWKVADEWYIAMDKSPLQSQSSNVKSQNKKQNTQTLRERMMDVAKKINWIPEFGLDRELDWLKNMHDWLISKKNRYWGLALPIYECKSCGHFEVIGSKEELKKQSVNGWDQFEGQSPHKPYIDEVVIQCSKCNKESKRIDDVGNPWLDAGIVPYSTITENNQGKPMYLKDKKKWKEWFPADFITESFPGQFKNWFYSMIAMSTVLEDQKPFKTVLGFGTMLDEKGKPFHKSAGNAIEFVEGANMFGADIIRWACTSENPANNILFGKPKVQQVMRQFYLMLWNIYKFFVEYANLDKFDQSVIPSEVTFSSHERDEVEESLKKDKNNILDLWILNRFYETSQTITKSLIQYNSKDATQVSEEFVNDLSTWYIRRSRDRVWINSDHQEDKTNFYSTLYFILKNLTILLSPFIPFITEEIYTNLTNSNGTGGSPISVHLEDWPDFSKTKIDTKLIDNMQLIRNIVEAGHRVRKELKIKVKQPLNKGLITLKIKPSFGDNQYEKLLKSELNVKKIEWKTSKDIEDIVIEYDTKITPELEKEGQLRELIRKIQAERKKLGVKPDEKVALTIPKDFENEKELIKKRVLAKEIITGISIQVNKL